MVSRASLEFGQQLCQINGSRGNQLVDSAIVDIADIPHMPFQTL